MMPNSVNTNWKKYITMRKYDQDTWLMRQSDSELQGWKSNIAVCKSRSTTYINNEPLNSGDEYKVGEVFLELNLT